MPIGKNSINRVAAGLDSENAAPMAAEIPSVEIEKTIVEGTAAAAEPIAPAAEEKPAAKKPAAKKPAAKKPAAKKPAAKKPAAKKPVEEKPAEEKPAEEAAPAVAPELVGQAVAAPAPRRGRKPGTKNKKKPVAAKAPARATRIPRAPETAQAFLTVSIGEDLPVYLL